jgi:Tol biopolymer transport system component
MPVTAIVLSVIVISGCASVRYTALVDPGGCRVERIAVEGGTLQFQFNGVSPDASMLGVGWEKPGARGAYLLNLRTGARAALTSAIDNAVSFSPDGRKLISAVRTPDRRTEILEVDRTNGTTRIIASDPSADFLPSYSRDMSRVYFNSYRSGASDLYAIDLRRDVLTRLTTFDGYDAYARLSPDETHLAFHRNVGDDNYEVMTLNLATGEEQVLASSPGQDAYPAWSPDGRHLVFSSDRGNQSGQNDLYLMRADGHVVRRLTHGTNDTYATWAPNGRDVYFVSQREGHGIYRLRLSRSLECVQPQSLRD